MLDKGIIMEDIYLAVMNYNSENLNFIFSDQNSKELIGRITINKDISGIYDEENELYNQSSAIPIFKKYQEDLLMNINIKGVDNINNIVMSEEDNIEYKDGEYTKTKEWILETDGTNMLELLSNKMINVMKTSSNDINETYAIFGIEGARNKLIDEITTLIEFDGSYINSRHIELLVDAMTFSGILTSINRQGINRGDIGPLAKCSFEDTTDQLIKSSVFGEPDRLDGVSSNIMLGQNIKGGTNNCNILLDEDKLYKLLEEQEDQDQQGSEEIDSFSQLNSAFDNQDDNDDMCNLEDFKMNHEY